MMSIWTLWMTFWCVLGCSLVVSYWEQLCLCSWRRLFGDFFFFCSVNISCLKIIGDISFFSVSWNNFGKYWCYHVLWLAEFCTRFIWIWVVLVEKFKITASISLAVMRVFKLFISYWLNFGRSYVYVTSFLLDSLV